MTSTRAPGDDPLVDLLEEVVDLALGRLDDHLGIDEARRAHDLLDDLRRHLELVASGSRREEHDLVQPLHHLLEPERPVVACARQAEAVVDEGVLAAPVAFVLRVQLGHRHVALVDDEEEVLREVVDQGVRRLAVVPAVDVHRVVLDAVAVPDLLDHLEVVLGAHPQALRLEQLAVGFEPRESLLQLGLDADHGLAHDLVAGDVVRGREHDELGELGDLLTGERIDDRDAFDLVAEELDARDRLFVRGMELDRVAPHPELASAERRVVALVLHVDELPEDRALVALLPDVGDEELALVLRGVAHAVDARHRGDDDHVSTSQQRRGGRVAETVDLVVDRAVLLDVGVARRDVRLGLVVVVVRDEVLDSVLREELAELVRELRRERLVGGEHEGRSLHLLDRPRDRRALAAAGDAEEGLEPVAALDAFRELLDGMRLVASGFEVGDDRERRH